MTAQIKTPDKNCRAILKMVDNTYIGDGETIEEALNAIALDYTQIKYKGTIKVSQDGKSFERFFQLLPLRRLFASKIYKEHWANQVAKFLK